MSAESTRRQEFEPEPEPPDLLLDQDSETGLRALLRGIALDADEHRASSICAVCGTVIEGITGRVYCSRSCSAHARRVRRKDKRIRWLHGRNSGGSAGS